MNTNLPISPDVVLNWTPTQQIQALTQLVQVVMAQQSNPTISINCGGESDSESKIYLLTELPIAEVNAFTPSPDDDELLMLNRLAADPKNRLAMTEATLREIMD